MKRHAKLHSIFWQFKYVVLICKVSRKMQSNTLIGSFQVILLMRHTYGLLGLNLAQFFSIKAHLMGWTMLNSTSIFETVLPDREFIESQSEETYCSIVKTSNIFLKIGSTSKY